MLSVPGEVSDEMNELKSIQKEIKELQVKKEELQNNTKHKEYTNGGMLSSLVAQRSTSMFFYSLKSMLESFVFEKAGHQEQCGSSEQTPRGGVYMLPPLLPSQDVPAAEQTHSPPFVPGWSHLYEGVVSAWCSLNVLYLLILMSRFLGGSGDFGPHSSGHKMSILCRDRYHGNPQHKGRSYVDNVLLLLCHGVSCCCTSVFL